MREIRRLVYSDKRLFFSVYFDPLSVVETCIALNLERAVEETKKASRPEDLVGDEGGIQGVVCR